MTTASSTTTPSYVKLPTLGASMFEAGLKLNSLSQVRMNKNGNKYITFIATTSEGVNVSNNVYLGAKTATKYPVGTSIPLAHLAEMSIAQVVNTNEEHAGYGETRFKLTKSDYTDVTSFFALPEETPAEFKLADFMAEFNAKPNPLQIALTTAKDELKALETAGAPLPQIKAAKAKVKEAQEKLSTLVGG